MQPILLVKLLCSALLLHRSQASIVEDVEHSSTETWKTRLLLCPIDGEGGLQGLYDLAVSGLGIDILEERVPEKKKGGHVHVLATESAAKVLLAQAKCMEQKSSATGRHAQRVSDEIVTGGDFDSDYRSFEAMKAQITHYQLHHPHLIKSVKVIGKSHEGRELIVLHMSARTDTPANHPQIWIQASQHAREWIAAASLFATISQLIAGYTDGDAEITRLLTNYELVLMPMVNPDGYEYSRKHDRMWRKNRAHPHGVDLNRNWDANWGQFGCPASTTSDMYCGSGAGSEAEVAAVQRYVLGRLPNRVLGLDIHSYSQLVLYNYGWTFAKTPIDSVLQPIATAMASAMTAVANQLYSAQQSSVMAAVCGGADDWFFMKAGIPGFTLELRDHGARGFRLPAGHIRDSAAELLAALLAALDSLAAIGRVHVFPNRQLVL